MSKKLFYILILLVIASLFAVVLFALAADVTTAGASDECWPGCPHPPLRPQIWLPIVQQCKGAYCDLGGWGEAPAK